MNHRFRVICSRPTPCVFLAIALVAGVGIGSVAGAQQPAANDPQATQPAAPSSEPLTAAAIDARVKDLDANSQLPEETKVKIRDLYQQAKTELDQVAVWQEQQQKYEQQVSSAPAALEQAKLDIAAPPVAPEGFSEQMPLTDMEAQLGESEKRLEDSKKELARLEAEPARRATRRAEIPARITELKPKLDEVIRQLEAPAAADEPAAMTAARRTTMAVRKAALEAEILAVEKELAAYDAEVELVRLQRDLADRLAKRLEQQVKLRRDQVLEQRKKEAERQAQQAKEVARGTDLDSIKKLAEENAALAEQRTDLLQRVDAVNTSLDRADQTLKRLGDEFQRTKDRVSTGLTTAIGIFLRKQRTILPDTRRYRRSVRMRQPDIRQTQLDLFDHQDQSGDLDLDAEAASMAARLADDAEDMTPQQLEQLIHGLLADRKEILAALVVEQNRLFDSLVDLDQKEQQIIQQTNEFAEYINERVLWVRSADSVLKTEMPQIAEAAIWLVNTGDWVDIGLSLVADAKSNYAIYVLALIVLLPLGLNQSRLRRELAHLGEIAGRGNAQRYMPSLQALLLTLLISVFWPTLMWFLAWRVGSNIGGSMLSRSFGIAMATTATMYFSLEFLRQICRSRGLAESHFNWSSSAVRIVRSNLHWYVPLSLPLLVVTVMLYTQDNERWHDSLGRLTFIALMLFSSLLLHLVTRPSKGVLRDFLARHEGGWIQRLRYVWYPLIVMLPVILSVLAAVGYIYTAEQLALRLKTTLLTALGLLILGALAFRWVTVNRRRLATQQARERLAAAASTEEGAPPPPANEESAVNLFLLNMQTQRLISGLLVVTGLITAWMIWSDVMPALGVLDRVTLWHTDGIEPGTKEPITLANLAWAIPVLVMTWIAARNLPGLMEIVLLQQLPLESSIRYAISTLSRYMIVLVGILMACGAMGVTWSKAQWLVAALGVGLGFGLQEIFANFVSGLILLFERPIRVGDIITLGESTGTVTRIRIRATTITDWDRKELVVPNKDLITGRLLNWTLTDQTNRITLNVGIAYGSDTNLATRLLRQIADEHPAILKDPAPIVTFQEFGDSVLLFVLRAYLSRLDQRLPTTHELNSRIHLEFKSAGIEIAFPQRDLHIRSFTGQVALPLLGQDEDRDGNGSAHGNGSHSDKQVPSDKKA